MDAIILLRTSCILKSRLAEISIEKLGGIIENFFMRAAPVYESIKYLLLCLNDVKHWLMADYRL